MNIKSLIAGAALLGSFCSVGLDAVAADQPEQTVQSPEPASRPLKVGDMAPDKLARATFAVQDWKSKGLRQPEKDSQWVRIDDKYALIKITNAQIVDIVPAKK